MRRTKEQKGITLIALIITIVVLMILAAVAINSIRNEGIISKAEGAADKYTEEQQKEQDMLDYYEAILAETAWTQNGATVTRNGQTLNVGDEIAIVTGTDTSTQYTANGYSAWKVLGVEYGKLLLVSATDVVSGVTLGGENGGKILHGVTFQEENCEAGFNNGIEYLNEKCEPYLNSDYADKVRSLKIEDINRILEHKPYTETNYYQYTADELERFDLEILFPREGSVITASRFGEYGVSVSGFYEITLAYNGLLNIGEYTNGFSAIWNNSDGDTPIVGGIRAVVTIKPDVKVVKV